MSITKKDVKILVIGNGFDLAHGLPTKYTDFLQFLRDVIELENSQEILAERFYSNYSANIKKHCDYTLADVIHNKMDFLSKAGHGCIMLDCACNAFKRQVDSSCMIYKPTEKEIRSILDDLIGNLPLAQEQNAILAQTVFGGNYWLTYISDKWERNKMRGENWIDFEYEIMQVVRKIEDVIQNGNAGSVPYEANSIEDLMAGTVDDPGSLLGKGNLLSRLENDLELLVRSLEIYLTFVNKLPLVEKNPDMENIGEIHHLLNFNYTDTYEKLYRSGSTGVLTKDMIHGQVGRHNMIVGISETLLPDKMNRELSCIRFKKYFQRIDYKTGLEYKKWFEQDLADTLRIIVYIFGHSLDETDGDVLRYILTNENVCQTQIYYHDETQHRSQIANLVKIIGKDILIEKTGNGSIVFCEQKR